MQCSLTLQPTPEHFRKDRVFTYSSILLATTCGAENLVLLPKARSLTMNLKPLPRRIILALTCAAALSTPLLAQDPSSPPPPRQQGPNGDRMGEMQQRHLEHMTRALHLSPDQVSQIKAIQEDSRRQMMGLRGDSSVQGSDKHASMMAIRDAQNTKVKAVLNDEQKAKYDTMQEHEREHRQEHGEHGGDSQAPPPPPGV